MRALFARLTYATARTYGLVLTSAGISHQTRCKDSQYTIAVSTGQRAAAIKAVALYLSENPTQLPVTDPKPAAGFKTFSALYIVPILALIHGAVRPGYEHQVFVDALGADAARITAGELYRCVTALLLHNDWAHLVNNMAAMLLFGTVTASLCGWGAGWFMILLSGAAGNLVTALWYGKDHISIGASTAVFGALGLCVALNLWRHVRMSRTSWRMWMPLGGGVALLAFLGASPNSDLMAHAAGFGCGGAIGGIYGWRYQQPPGRVVQWATAIAGVGMMGLSWVAAIFSAGG
jgi:membrane associated rhomboid family serine protease